MKSTEEHFQELMEYMRYYALYFAEEAVIIDGSTFWKMAEHDVDSAHRALAQALVSRRKNDKVANRALEVNLGELRGAEPSGNRGVASLLKASGMLVGAGLALVGVVTLVHSLVWTAIVPRPQPNIVAVTAARPFLAAARPSRHLARNRPRSARLGAPPHLSSTPRVELVAPPSILLLSMLPRKVFAGDTATLCVSADHAQRLFITGLGAFNPKLTTCHTVLPKKTTSFVAYATNTRGQRTKRKITVVVERTVLAGELHWGRDVHGRRPLRGRDLLQPGRFRLEKVKRGRQTLLNVRSV
jgi:hypothetical protein